jgi:diaminopimelate decarboxylase
VDEQRLGDAAALFGTPCYVYSEEMIRDNVSRFTGLHYPHKAIYFASMANNNPRLLEIVRSQGLGVFVNSRKHLELVLDQGFGPTDIVYTSTGVRRSDLEFLAAREISVNIDSPGQLRLYGEINPGGRCGIRLNIDENSLDNVFTGNQSRIGVLDSEFAGILQIAKQYDLTIVGTHVYLGTNIVSLPTMIRGVRRTLELSNAFPDLEYVDLGGGFPVTDSGLAADFDYIAYDRQILELFEAYSKERGRPIQLILEPGRALFGDTAVFCTSVLDVKERPDRLLVCCDSSAALFPRSMFYNEFHDVHVLGKDSPPRPATPADVVGATTYSRDFLAKGVHLPPVEPGDVLVFDNAGSYCFSMITSFLGQTEPCEILDTVDGRLLLVRAREPIGGVA